MDKTLGSYLSSMTINVTLAVALLLLFAMAFCTCVAAYLVTIVHLPQPGHRTVASNPRVGLAAKA